MADQYLDALHALFGLPEKSLETWVEKLNEKHDEEDPKLDDAQ